MKNFEFNFPTKIVFGRGAEEQVGKLSSVYGGCAMLLYGSERIKHSGLYQLITAKLEGEGMLVIPFGGISENPTISKAEEGCRLAREKNVTLLLAVGGGSVIDTAKAVSIGTYHNGSLWELYQQKKRAASAIPIGVVLTMAATASEANSVSVLRHEGINKKAALNEPLTCPRFALLNPELTYSVPSYQTAAGAVDIFSHAFERYFHKEQTGTLRSHLCEGVMCTVIHELPLALAKPKNYDVRSQLMWSATVAHSDILGEGGDYACHALSHVITSEFGLSHGAALGILMPAWCKFMLAGEADAIAGFSVRVWKIDNTESIIRTAEKGISAFQNFIRSAGLPVTMQEAGFHNVSIEQLADKVLESPAGFIGGNFRRLYRNDILNILQLAYG